METQEKPDREHLAVILSHFTVLKKLSLCFLVMLYVSVAACWMPARGPGSVNGFSGVYLCVFATCHGILGSAV